MSERKSPLGNGRVNRAQILIANALEDAAGLRGKPSERRIGFCRLRILGRDRIGVEAVRRDGSSHR